MNTNIIDLTVTSAYDGKPSFALCGQEGHVLYKQVKGQINEEMVNMLVFPEGTRVFTSFYENFFKDIRTSMTVGWIKEHFTVNIDRKPFDCYIMNGR